MKSLFTINRRQFFFALIAGGAGLWTITSNKFSRLIGSGSRDTLAAIIDTIIPADENTIGAISAGLEPKVEQLIATSPRWNKRVSELVIDVENFSLESMGQPFDQLNLDAREQLLLTVLKLDLNDHLQLRGNLSFFRNQIMRWYYSSTAGHNGLNYILPTRYPTYSRKSDG